MYSQANSPSRITPAQERHQEAQAECSHWLEEALRDAVWDMARRAEKLVEGAPDGFRPKLSITQEVAWRDDLIEQIMTLLKEDRLIDEVRFKVEQAMEEPLYEGREYEKEEY